MISGLSPARRGMLAGAIAILCALLGMRVFAEMWLPVAGPNSILVDAAARHVNTGPLDLVLFFYEGNALVRFTVAVVIVLLIIGVILGAWVNSGSADPRNHVIAAAFTLFGILVMFVFSARGGFAQYYRGEIVLILALTSIVFGLGVLWLLKPAEHDSRWGIAGLLAVASIAVLAGEIVVTE